MRGDKMKVKKKLVLKPFVIPAVYAIFALAVITSLFFTIEVEHDKDNLTYVSRIILDDSIPVIKTEDKILKPYNDEKVKIINDFYDYEKEEPDPSSILLYENTYVQNTGINYSSDNEFEIVSILDGEVIDVKEEELLGKSVTIRHNNELISVYQSIKDIQIKEGDKVIAGQVIGKSGSCSLIKDSVNNLHFELYANGTVVNPKNYLDKKLGEI